VNRNLCRGVVKAVNRRMDAFCVAVAERLALWTNTSAGGQTFHICAYPPLGVKNTQSAMHV
jgi:hypothetical protein